MRFAIPIPLLIFVLGVSAIAQQRDFLSTDEIEQVRLTPDPNERMKLYDQFARQRISQVRRLMETEKPGRSALVHDLLEDYTKIIEAIDSLADDSLAHKKAITVGIAAVAATEKETLEQLNKISDAKPKDLQRYDFALREALETTQDSLELNEQDLGHRAGAVEAKEKNEKAAREAAMKPEEPLPPGAKRPGQTADGSTGDGSATASTTNVTPKRKPPTLLRPGETISSGN
jgi:hypothetical protein